MAEVREEEQCEEDQKHFNMYYGQMAPPPHGRSAHLHGVREEEQGYFLGGNN